MCPKQPDGPVCPLTVGVYKAAVHDAFSFSINEEGWQEERAQTTEFGTTVVLSRVDDPDLRLTFLSGATGPSAPVDIHPAAIAPAGVSVSLPRDVTISGTKAQYVDLISGDAAPRATVTIDGADVSIAPDRTYRLTVAKIPMDAESATLVAVAEAPRDKFTDFVDKAVTVVRSVKF